MENQFRKDIKSLAVRLVGDIAKGVKINNMLVLCVLSPLYLAFIWTVIRAKLTAMLFSKAFYLKPLLRIDGREEEAVLAMCILMSIFLIFPFCRILQLAFPKTFEPFADSTDSDE